MKRLTLAELVEGFQQSDRWRGPRPMSAEQKARLGRMLPALERLHDRMDVHGSAAFVELAHLWTKEGMQQEPSYGLEFLAQQAEEAAQLGSRSSIANEFLELRRPWRAAGGRGLSPNGADRDFPGYGEFMLAAVSALQALPDEQKGRYLGLAKLAVETELGTGSKFITGSFGALRVYGMDGAERYARAGFDWLGKWRSGQKGTHHETYVGREVLRSVWYFLTEHKGAEEGAQRLRDHLVQFGDVADYMENNLFFLTAEMKLMGVVFVPANRMTIWRVFREISEIANSGERIGYRLWEAVNSVADLAQVEKEEDAVRFAQALKDNYLATLARALESSKGKIVGRAADLFDTRNAKVITEQLYDEAFWQSLYSMFSEVPVSSPGAWVPNTSEAASSLLDAVKGSNFTAEKSLLAGSIEDIAQRIDCGPILDVLYLGVGSGEKEAAMAQALALKVGQINACVVDKNLFIAFAGAEALIRSLKFVGGDLFFNGGSVSLHGKVVTQESGTPLTVTAIVEYFERLKQHPAYQKFAEQHPGHLVAEFGNTPSNSEPETAFGNLRDLVRRHALIGLYLYDGNDVKLVQSYDTPENLGMGRQHLIMQGVKEEDFGKLEHIVEIRKKGERVGPLDLGIVTRLLTYFKVRPGQRVQGALREFSDGDVINVGLSIKYTDAQVNALFRNFGFGMVSSYYNDKGNVALYLVERIQRPVEAQPGR